MTACDPLLVVKVEAARVAEAKEAVRERQRAAVRVGAARVEVGTAVMQVDFATSWSWGQRACYCGRSCYRGCSCRCSPSPR